MDYRWSDKVGGDKGKRDKGITGILGKFRRNLEKILKKY